MFNLSPKTKKLVGRGLRGLGLLVIVGIVAWFTLIKPYLIRQEKKRFEAASASLAQLAEEIQAKIGKADEVVQDNSCGRANLKSEKGPLLCDVSYNLIYKDVDYIKANQYLKNFTAFGTNLRSGSPNIEQHIFTLNEGKRTPQILYQDLPTKSGFRCSLGYSYPVSNNFSESEKARFSLINVYAVNISCGGPAKSEHFPVEN